MSPDTNNSRQLRKGVFDNKFLDTLVPRHWFKDTGAQELIDNARRQLRVANGVPIRWHVAEDKAAQAIRLLLREARSGAIEVIYTPMLP